MMSSSDDEAVRAGRYVNQYMIDAAYAQLVGLCRGVLADHELADAEVAALDEWLATYATLLPEWPGQRLARFVREALCDGLIEDSERRELRDFIEQLSGLERGYFDEPTTLPLTRPEPHIEYDSRAFCLTGTFAFGPRRQVEHVIKEWGGRVVSTVVQADYLVIGATVTGAWKYGTHGLKIQEAIELIERGRSLAIVSESHWSTSLC